MNVHLLAGEDRMISVAVTDAAITTIKEMIVSGELRPGQRLPPEKELGERLGVSRNSLREAVKSLELIRVLDVRRGDGTYVTSLRPELLLEAMSFVVDLHQDASVLEIFAVRRILEPAAAELAVMWRATGHRVVAVDTLPDLDRTRLSPQQALALRIVLAERGEVFRELATTGIDVVRWDEDPAIALSAAARIRVGGRR